MTKKEKAFSVAELLVVMLIVGIIAAVALPYAINALDAYRLHTDATLVSSYVNIAQTRAASQFSPYRLVVNVAPGTYTLEKLCGPTLSSVDAACTSAYNPFTTPQIEGGTQYPFQGDTFASCRPGGISVYPPPITGNPSPCPDPLYIYFNTRGTPVDSSGSPLGNGGAAVYIQSQRGLVDAVTISVSGRVSIRMWNPAGTQWTSR